MGRIIGIDYGLKRTGLAWTDPLQIVASRLESCEADRLKDRLLELVKTEEIEAFVLGFPTRSDGSDTDATVAVREFALWLGTTFSEKKVHLQDERFTSKQAMRTMIAAGVSKKKRRDKHLINEVSAVLILQDFLGHHF